MNIQTKLLELKFERVIPAPVPEVFDAWLDPAIPGKPWHNAARLIFKPEVDSAFYFLTRKDGGGFPHYGRFTEIARPAKVQHTFVSPFTSGLESLVTITFEKQGEGTLLTLRHEGLPDTENGRRHEQGWNYLLGVMVEHHARNR